MLFAFFMPQRGTGILTRSGRWHIHTVTVYLHISTYDVLPPLKIVNRFGLSRYIDFTIHLDIANI
jgi:hypothetical protein